MPQLSHLLNPSATVGGFFLLADYVSELHVRVRSCTCRITGRRQRFVDGNTRAAYIQWNPERSQSELDEATTCKLARIDKDANKAVANDKKKQSKAKKGKAAKGKKTAKGATKAKANTPDTAAFRNLAINQTALKDSIKGCDVKGCGSGELAGKVSIPTKAPKAGLDLGCEYVSGNGSLDRKSSPSLVSNITVPAGYEAHHLIGVAEAKNSKIMRRAAQLGYHINGPHNGEAFPSYGSKNVKFKDINAGRAESARTGLPLHKGRHAVDKYTFCVEKYLERLETDYRAGRINDCNLCNHVEKVETKILNALKSHKIWLNSRDPHIQSGQQPTCP